MNQASLSSSLFVGTFAYLFAHEISNNNSFKIHELEGESRACRVLDVCPQAPVLTGMRTARHPWGRWRPRHLPACTPHVARGVAVGPTLAFGLCHHPHLFAVWFSNKGTHRSQKGPRIRLVTISGVHLHDHFQGHPIPLTNGAHMWTRVWMNQRNVLCDSDTYHGRASSSLIILTLQKSTVKALSETKENTWMERSTGYYARGSPSPRGRRNLRAPGSDTEWQLGGSHLQSTRRSRATEGTGTSPPGALMPPWRSWPCRQLVTCDRIYFTAS